MPHPQAIGFWPFDSDTEDFGTEINKIKAVANAIRAARMPAEIPVGEAKKLFTRTLDAATRFTSEGQRMQEKFSNLLASGPITSAVLAVLEDLRKMNQRLLYDIIRPAESAGKKTVPSAPFIRETSKMMMSIAFGFEALQDIDDSKGTVVRYLMADPFMPFIFSYLSAAGSVVNRLAEFMPEFPKPNLGPWIELMKWGSISFLLYYLHKSLSDKP